MAQTNWEDITDTFSFRCHDYVSSWRNLSAGCLLEHVKNYCRERKVIIGM